VGVLLCGWLTIRVVDEVTVTVDKHLNTHVCTVYMRQFTSPNIHQLHIHFLSTVTVTVDKHLKIMFGWPVADGWCWFVMREEYCWLRLVAGGWFVLREKHCWLVADKPSEQGVIREYEM
jgi:hypothetical protein